MTSDFDSDAPDAAGDNLFARAYGELRALAEQHLQREPQGHTLQPTALVHEAYLRLASQRAPLENRAQFLALAARAMRRVLVDHARRKQSAKRGKGQWRRITLEESLLPSGERAVDTLALDEALEQLAALDARMGQIVELRFFGGLDIGEIAGILGVSDRTVDRDWFVARAWLARSLAGDHPS